MKTSPLLIIYIICCLLCPLYITAQNIPDSIKNRTIIIRGDSQLVPFEFINKEGKPDGFNIDIYKALMKRLGLTYDIQLGDFAKARKDLENNKIDLLSMIYLPERAQHVKYGISISTLEYAIISRQEDKYQTLDDLYGKNIIVQNKDGAHDMLLQKEASDYIIPVCSIEEGLHLLNNGEYDAMLSFSISAYYFIHEHKYSNLTIANISDIPVRYCIAVNKNDNDLLELINMGLYQMKIDGEYDEIYDSWFGVRQQLSTYWNDIIPYIIVAIAVLFLLILFIFILRIKIKKAQKYITERESRFFQIYNSINDAIFIFDMKTKNVVNCNKVAIKFFRAPNKLFITSLDLQYYFHEIGLNAQELALRAQQESFSFEWKMRRLDKTFFWASIEIKSALIGQHDRILCVMRDISQRKMMENKLDNANQQLRIAINAGDISVWSYSFKTKRFASVQGHVICDGASFREGLQRMDSESSDVFFNKIKGLVHGHTEKTSTIFKYIDLKDQHALYYETMMTVAKTDDGKISHIIGSQKDITSKYELHKKLEEYKIKTSLAIQVTGGYQFDYDTRDHTLLISYGFDNKVVAPIQKVIDRVHPEDFDLFLTYVSKLNAGVDDTFSFEIRHIPLRNNVYQWSAFNITPYIFDENGKVILYSGIFRNSTRWHDISDELSILRDKAEEANRLKSAFLANLSHEIRTPLNAIVGFSELLAQSDDLSRESKEDYANVITNNTDILLQLINDIMDIARLESQPNLLTLKYTGSSVDQLLQEVIHSIRLKIKTNISIQYTITPPDLVISTDVHRLKQILNNLIGNAIKFSDEGAVHVICKLQESSVYFSVSDNGCGIPAEKTNSIFERFVKLDTFKQGTGLGLSICKYLITKMGGAIGVMSKVNEGSTFWFTLPYLKSSVTPKESIRIESSEDLYPKGISMLVAEDDPSNFKLIQSIFKDYQIYHAWNGNDAIRICKEEDPQIILMDIKMPKMDGYEAVEEIRKKYSYIPIIAVTAYAFEDDENRIKASGFDDYASKPLYPNVLRQKVRNLLNKKGVIKE